ncbi:hypothetical protein [Lysobacter fragariae]
MLGILAGASVLASELMPLSVPLAVGAVAHGAWLARRELRRPVHGLVIALNDTTATCDGIDMTDLQIQWRGPLAFLRWRDAQGQRRHLHGGPGNLDATARRELRLAMAARAPFRAAARVAP